MVSVYISPFGRARCISFDESPVPEPFTLVATFAHDQVEDAWELLHELAGDSDPV